MSWLRCRLNDVHFRPSHAFFDMDLDFPIAKMGDGVLAQLTAEMVRDLLSQFLI